MYDIFVNRRLIQSVKVLFNLLNLYEKMKFKIPNYMKKKMKRDI